MCIHVYIYIHIIYIYTLYIYIYIYTVYIHVYVYIYIYICIYYHIYRERGGNIFHVRSFRPGMCSRLVWQVWHSFGTCLPTCGQVCLVCLNLPGALVDPHYFMAINRRPKSSLWELTGRKRRKRPPPEFGRSSFEAPWSAPDRKAFGSPLCLITMSCIHAHTRGDKRATCCSISKAVCW